MTKLFLRAGLAVIFALFLGVNARSQQTLNNIPAELVAYPDLIIHNARIVSMDDASLSNATGSAYEAMAVKEDRIQFLGSNADVLRYAGPSTRKIDLKGRTVVPGIIGTHTHLHDHAVSRWVRNNPDKVQEVAKRFSVTGNTFQEITEGIELVIKENMAHPLPGQWAMISLPGGGAGRVSEIL